MATQNTKTLKSIHSNDKIFDYNLKMFSHFGLLPTFDASDDEACIKHDPMCMRHADIDGYKGGDK